MKLVLKNLFWVTLGNIIGAGVLLVLRIKFMSIKEEKKNKIEILVENINKKILYFLL
ncbi:hypothetical protein [Clostridium sp. CCUG 7971]|uniref:hypothetical protein n=1 Tax=Clostridium sp. CCUG 7971 TaxID=2811414 RepID=UPI001ABB5DB4|nr:hypothetical protein [Clostridium sp. CCUG 7971]MBO3446252.1 hypothetical protein [Clostridium sp. CCUG 7971]